MSQLQIFWYGYGGSSWMAERLRSMIEDELGMKLVTIHEHPDANIKWNLSTVYKELQKADIIIIPANYKRQPCKSNNRLTQSMALGKPVICDPLPAYIPIIKQGVNGFMTIDGKPEEYKWILKYLRDNEDIRKSVGERALETSKEYSLEEISRQWAEALVQHTKGKINEKAVDVIIPTKNNIEILDECLKSFKNSTLEEEIYIIDNGDGAQVEELVKSYNVPYEVKKV